MKITVLNFHKYHPRKSYKSMPWLKLQNKIYRDPKLIELPITARWLWIVMLCHCAEQMSDTIVTTPDVLAVHCCSDSGAVMSILKKFASNNMILLGQALSKQSKRLLEEEEEEEEEKDKYIAPLDELYGAYPLHEGKARGMKKLGVDLKSDEDVALFRMALKNYIAAVDADRQGGFERRYMQFSRFANCWRDYLDTVPQQPKPGRVW